MPDMSPHAVTIRPLAPWQIVDIAPFRCNPSSLAAILADAGFPAPEAGRTAVNATGRTAWAGRGHYFAIAPAGAPDIAARLRPLCAERAALTTQGDGRCAFRIGGERSAAFLGSATGIDLHPGIFRDGDVALGQIGHIGVHFWRTDEEGFDCLVFRSLANALHHHLTEAAAMFAAC
ncbi:hypothetical protein [Nguyenibacter sp. L1]|uniref:sarcosine oxidase subunit gamma n=1 Tax=Nguyenibacter sp. L1 TaxID=3049350 RepID=UPI002B487451|nr:hypothetical protein [Nguyenibacter sp. L1]WRH87125.1 hypothetical protein QN315_14185 [Nguyenibacter sp. L1]